MEKITQQLKEYYSKFSEEMDFKEKMLGLMKIKSNEAFLRASEDAHFTASAWLIDKNNKRILLLKHSKLNKWLQPGGHADGILDLEQVAIKEAKEETNLQNLTLISKGIFDIDIHKIPQRNTVKEHEHYDVRYAFMVNDSEATKINFESKEFMWLSIDEIKIITSNPSILRMVDKTKKLI